MILDAGTSDSFAGEPATNLIPDAGGVYGNSRFTTANSWGTYNTNNYTGGAFTSIGTIGSVSSNQVTVSSWAKGVYSLDALRPQTTGGGVTANQDYFIFFVNGNDHNSGAPFEIYTFNASQDGSQGYINPTTGYPAVYDGIFDNGRRPNSDVGSAGSGIVTLTGTPTNMWWGYPHLPNTSIVKEVVPGGGRIKGTPCMRIHCPRGWWRSMAGDGMAYGVYTPVTSGDTIRLSFWHRPSPFGFGGEGCAGTSPSWSTYFGGAASGSSTFYLSSTVGEWKYETYTWTASATYSFYFYLWPSSSGVAYSMDIADLIVTVNEGGAVPWVGGTRSNSNSGASLTGGWADLSGNDRSGDFSSDMGPDNLYHFRDDSAMRIMADSTVNTTGAPSDDPMIIDFDGTGDYVDFGSDVMFKSGGGWTVESWVRPDAVSSGPYNFIGSLTINYNSWYWSVLSSKLAMWDLSPGNVWKYGNTTLSTGQWYHAVLVSDPDNTSYYIYLNGEDDMSSGWSSYNGSWQSSKSSLAIAYLGRGSAAHARYWDGQMSNVSFYNKALTAAEVKQNFNAQRSKFKV
jgi:hypothetical protein